MKKNFLLRAIYATTGCILFTAVSALAQPGSGGPGPGNSPTSVPIDGGASLLLAAGGAYGLKRLRDIRASRRKAK
jgi:hypothetical protein